MRVALDVTPLLDRATGVGAFTAAVATGLGASDTVEVVGYATSWRGRGRLAKVVPPGLAVVRRPMAARPLRAAWKRADRPRIEHWTGHVRVVHGTNFVVPPSRAAAIATVHDLTPIRFPEACTADTLEYPDLLRRALRRGAWVHCPSDAVAREVVDLLGARPDRVVSVPNGVTPIEGDAAAGRATAGFDQYVLALGTVEPRKGLPDLADAMAEVWRAHGDVGLVHAGPAGWDGGAFDRAVKSSPHPERCRRLGWVEDRTRADLVAGAAVFAYPSLYEGFGLPPLEAMSAGVPVVATETGALSETLGDAAGLVAPHDAEALGDGLSEAIAGGEAIEARVARGRSRAARFTWDRCVTGLIDLYRRAAG